MKGNGLAHLFAQPLIQFVAIGAMIFAGYALFGSHRETAPSEIAVNATQLRWLRDTWQGQFGRPPDAVEMRAAVAAYVDEEMRYREGIALGLDRDDTIVRRRLAQKYDFTVGAEATEAAPTDAQLRAVFDRQPQRYLGQELSSFCQVYFGAGKAGLARATDAVAALAPAAARNLASLPKGSDSLPYARCYNQASPTDAGRDFGDVFAGTLDRLPLGMWQGPVESGYGFHAVIVSARTPGRLLDFAQARARVEADWRQDVSDRARALEEQDLRRRYHVSIDEGALAAMTRQAAR